MEKRREDGSGKGECGIRLNTKMAAQTCKKQPFFVHRFGIWKLVKLKADEKFGTQ